MFLVASPQQIVTNFEALLAVVVIAVAGLIAVSHLSKGRVTGIIITVAIAALVWLAIKGSLIQDVSTWFTDLGV